MSDDYWFNFKTGKVVTPRELLKRLTPEQLLGAEYAFRLLQGVRAKSQKTIREYARAAEELLPDKKPHAARKAKKPRKASGLT